ncbi:MAG: hypothetical protein MUO76_15795 [Anaerolineaceae bacterium]|nr:hypothetical protein [Anaerolineaceae bacterium]
MSSQQQEYENDMQQKRSALPHRRCQGRVLGSGGKMKAQIKHFAERVFKDRMKGLEAQIKQNLAGLGYEI